MSDTRIRFFPLVRDEQWGLRLHQSDLAINKVLAASSRRKARDFADIVAISANMCPIGPLVMAAAGKPPAYSPQKMIDRMRGHAQTISDDARLPKNRMSCRCPRNSARPRGAVFVDDDVAMDENAQIQSLPGSWQNLIHAMMQLDQFMLMQRMTTDS